MTKSGKAKSIAELLTEELMLIGSFSVGVGGGSVLITLSLELQENKTIDKRPIIK